MKYLIVICVLIYFELVATYPYGEEYSKATQPPSERRLQFSNFPQTQYAPPGIYYQNGFASEPARPYFGNVEGQGGYRASNVPFKTGLNLKPVQRRNFDNLLLGNQLNKSPVQLPPRQPGFNIEFLENQAKLSQLQAQHAAVPHLDSVKKPFLKPVVRQVDYAKNIENAAVAIRPQFYSNDQNLPLVNVPPSSRTVNIKKLQNDPLQITKLNSNIGVDKKKYAQELPSNLQLPNIAGNNIQRLLNNPKLREVLSSTKNKKRYMVVYPNGQVEHLDSIEQIAAQHPNHLVLNSSAINKIRDTLRSPSLTTSNFSPSPALPLYSNVPSQSPAIPLKPTTSSSPTLRPPQVPLSNTPRSQVIPLVPNTSSSSAVLPSKYPSQHVSSSISRPPSIPLKSNAQSSLVIQSTKNPSNLKNSLASTSAVVVSSPVSFPIVPPVIPISQKSTSKFTSVPASTNPHVSSKQKPTNELPLLQQLHSPAPLVLSDSEKTGKRSISSPEIDSTHSTSNLPINATKKVPISTPMTSPTSTIQVPEKMLPFQPPVQTPMTSPTSTIQVPEKKLPLTITEVNSKPLLSHYSPVTTLSASKKKSYQTFGSNNIHTNSLSSEHKKNKYTPSVKILPKPIAMVSPTPVTPSASIDLADLFPIIKEEDANMAKLSNSAVTHKNATKSTESLTSTADLNALDHSHYDKKALTTDDGKPTVVTNTITVSNVSTHADEKQQDKIGKELKVTNSNYSLHAPKIKSSVSTSSDEQPDQIGKELKVNNSNNSLQTPEVKSSSSSSDEQDKKRKELEETNLNNSLQKPGIKSNAEEQCAPSVKQTAIQDVSDKDAQSESQALYKNDSTSFDSPSLPEEQSNTDTDAETSEPKNTPKEVDTTSASSSIGSLQKPEIKLNAEERCDPSVKQTAIQEVSNEDAQSESQALYNNDSTSFDSPSLPEEQSNTDTDAETSEPKNTPKEVDTTSASSSIGSLQKPEIKLNAEERCDPSVKQTAIQEVSNKDAQSESQALYNNDSTSFDSPSLPEEQSNTDTDAETSEPKNTPKEVDTTSAQQLSSTVAADESSDGKIDLIEGKKNIVWFTQPTYDQIWNKLLEAGAVTTVYIIQMPSHNNSQNEEVNRIAEHYLKTREDEMQIFNAARKEDKTSN